MTLQMIKKTLIGLMLLVCLAGCTANERAKNFGGFETLKLPNNQKLVNVTWKDDHMWYLIRPMRADESAEMYHFKEKSSYGMLEGTVEFIERKTNE